MNGATLHGHTENYNGHVTYFATTWPATVFVAGPEWIGAGVEFLWSDLLLSRVSASFYLQMFLFEMPNRSVEHKCVGFLIY